MIGLGARRARLAAALRWRPEWPLAVVVVLAWIVLAVIPGMHGEVSGLAEAAEGGRPTSGAAPSGAAAHQFAGHDHGGHRPTSDGMGSAMPTANAPAAIPGMLGALGGWTLMTIGMMVPVTLPAVRHVGLNSLRSRRRRAMAVYVAVFVGVWVAFGAVALTAERIAHETSGVDGRVLLALALTVAATWQLTRIKRRALFACRRTVPLPPVGRRADAGCARFALVQGWRCVVSCWALMLVMLVAGHAALVWMAVLTALMVVEELTRIGRRLVRPSAAPLALTAGLVALGI